MAVTIDRETYLRIAKPRATCLLCGAPLVDARKHPSVLIPAPAMAESDEDIPQRQDYCSDCWQRRAEKNYLGFWITTRETPQPRKVMNRKERNARLAAYFDFLSRQQDPARVAKQYFLAHLLLRYGVFKWIRTEYDASSGRERIVCLNLIDDEEIVVESAELDDEQLVAIKQEIDRLLEGRLVAASEPDSPPASAMD